MNKIKISQSVAGKTIALVLGVLTMVFLISAIVQAWTEPSKTPPEGNVPAPINVSSNAQTKEGSLTIGDVFTIAGGGGESLVIRNGGDVKIYNANNSGSVLFYCDTDGQLTIPRNLKVGDTGTFDCINLGGVTKCSWPSGGNGGNGGNGGVGYWTQSDSSLYPNDNDWYVGIGTTDPGENKLRVVYSGLGSAIYASNDWGWAAVRGDAENGAGLYGLSTDGYGLYAASTNGYGVFGASSKGWAGYFQGDVYIDEDVGIGTTIPTERVDAVGYVKGRTGLCIGDDCRTEWPEGGDGVGYWTQSDSSLYPNSTNWRVAVGTTTPDSDSDVHIKDENDYTNLVLESTGANYFPLIKMRNDYGNWQIWASDDDFVIRRNGVETAIFADGEIGVVGINTDNPKQRLTINGDVGIWDAEELYFYTGQGASRIGYVGPGRNDDLSLVSQANGKWLRIGSENANITFWANGNVYSDDNPQMVIQPSGEVGIGIGDPTQKLDVDGFVKGRTGLCIGDDCRTEWPEGDGGIVCSDCDPRFVNEWETWNSDLTVTGNIRLGNVAGGGDKRLFLTSESGAHYITANNWWTQFISHDNEGWEFKDANSTSVKFNTDGPYSFYGNVEIKGDITEVDEICLDNGCRRDWPSGDGVDGDITAVYADDGLTGGATSGDAHLNVGAGTGISVDADSVNLAYPSKSCGEGYAIQSFNLGSEANPTCVEIGGDGTGYWTQSGSSLYPQNLSWKVGLGVDNPTEMLDVNGEARIRNGVISRHGLVTGTSDLGLYSEGTTNWIRLVANSGEIRFFIDGRPANGYRGGTSAMRIDSGGNVYVENLKNCDVVETDSSGKLICGTGGTVGAANPAVSSLRYSISSKDWEGTGSPKWMVRHQSGKSLHWWVELCTDWFQACESKLLIDGVEIGYKNWGQRAANTCWVWEGSYTSSKQNGELYKIHLQLKGSLGGGYRVVNSYLAEY